MGYSKLTELARKDFKPDHGLCEICPVERIDTIGSNDTPLDLNSTQTDAIEWLT